MSGLGHAPMQERGNIAGSLAHGDYFNGLLLDAIDDEIRIYRPEKNGIRRKIVASVCHTGIERKSVEGIEEFSYPAVGGINIVLGNIFPDFV
jgi:hypothetical protein